MPTWRTFVIIALCVRVRTGVAAGGADTQPRQVELPAFAVVAGLLVVGEAVVVQDDAGAAVLLHERHHDPRGPRRDGSVVRPAPGEHDPARRVDLDELAGRLHTVAHADPVRPTRYGHVRPGTAHPVRARSTRHGPPGTGTTAALLAVAAVLALGLGALLRRGVTAVTAAVVVIVLPYLLAMTVLPAGAADWLLRISPAAAFALQQAVPEYPQVANVYTPLNGYFPLAPWAGFAVLAAWAGLALGAAAVTFRRRDA
jgi:hypothetical protein